MNKTLIIMQGIPGSGKSWLATRLKEYFIKNNISYVECSVDDYFYDYGGGEYKFDGSLLPEFHRKCQEQARFAMQNNIEYVIINNTNLTNWEITPYVEMAKEYDYEIQVYSCQTSLNIAKKRNNERDSARKVPEDTINRMHNKMKKLMLD